MDRGSGLARRGERRVCTRGSPAYARSRDAGGQFGVLTEQRAHKRYRTSTGGLCRAKAQRGERLPWRGGAAEPRREILARAEGGRKRKQVRGGSSPTRGAAGACGHRRSSAQQWDFGGAGAARRSLHLGILVRAGLTSWKESATEVLDPRRSGGVGSQWRNGSGTAGPRRADTAAPPRI